MSLFRRNNDPQPVNPAKEHVRVYDEYGREMFITKDDWREKVLPNTLKSHWNDADKLYSVIVGAFNDGLIEDVLKASERLYDIDKDQERASCAYGLALLKTKQLDKAEHVFRGYLNTHPESGVVLANLAKIYAAQGDQAKAEDTLWHGLEIDPNQDNGLKWYGAINQDAKGETGWIEAMSRVRAVAGSWRPQLWLARAALKSDALQAATGYYREALSHFTGTPSADFLMQMSGDLGQKNHLRESLELTEPHFIPEMHGLTVGNNLIKAHVDLGELEAARRVLDQLYAQKRPDWAKTLSFWDTAIAKAHVAATPFPVAPMKSTVVCIEGPIWLKPGAFPIELLSPKIDTAPVISVLGGTAETASTEIQLQIADAPGRMSRALPLYLAESLFFNTAARVQALQAFIVGPPSGFVLSGLAWSDADACKYSLQTPLKSDYVFVLHLRTKAEPWIVEVRFLRSADSALVGTIETEFRPSTPHSAIPKLAFDCVDLVLRTAKSEPQVPPDFYQVPNSAHFGDYLLRLEQLLAVNSAIGEKGISLSGEHEIIAGTLFLCVSCPANVITRILLARMLSAMKKIRADVVEEVRDKVEALQKEKPLGQPYQDLFGKMFAEILKS